MWRSSEASTCIRNRSKILLEQGAPVVWTALNYVPLSQSQCRIGPSVRTVSLSRLLSSMGRAYSTSFAVIKNKSTRMHYCPFPCQRICAAPATPSKMSLPEGLCQQKRSLSSVLLLQSLHEKQEFNQELPCRPTGRQKTLREGRHLISQRQAQVYYS